ncbi:lysosomal proton-coupled steroid conjugate and bile acid symporter SLC46A3-like [Diadema antillarum]|uniref:lysosomal proton-coupled steroid conjugate and bile acid symporter SLC46A3-like n=1 Tax=Diadema antillarum TaxID=105358 RepID=UPI003A894F38
MAVQGTLATLRTFYITKRLEESFDHFIHQDGNGTCSSSNISDQIEKEMQSRTSLWIMWIDTLSKFPPIFTATFLVASSDSVGRKPILILSGVSHFLASIIFLLAVLFDLPLFVFLLAASVLGLCGDTDSVSMVSSAYIADSTEGKSRIQRMVVQSLMSYSGYGTGQVIAGVILDCSHNFSISFALPTLLAALNLAYTVCPGLVLETVPECVDLAPGRIVKDTIHSLTGFYTRIERSKRIKIAILIIILCFHRLVKEAFFDVVAIYGLGEPFCWTPTIVGCYYAGIGWFPSSATAVGILRTIPQPICKNIISKQVSVKEQGAAFAMLTVARSLSAVCSSLFLNGQFIYTVKLGLAQITFYVAAGILIIPIFLNW